MSNPVVVTAYFRPASGQHDRVVEALRPAIAAVHEEPGCELYAIHDAPDGTIVILGWAAGVPGRGDTASAVTSRDWGARPTLTAARELPLVSACAFRRRSGWSLR